MPLPLLLLQNQPAAGNAATTAARKPEYVRTPPPQSPARTADNGVVTACTADDRLAPPARFDLVLLDESPASLATLLQQSSVRRKLNLLTLLIALGVIALSVIAARMQYLDLTETRKTALKTQVELSYGILQHYHRLAGTGELSEAAAKAAALQALEVMRAENDTYYFNVYDTGYAADAPVPQGPGRQGHEGLPHRRRRAHLLRPGQAARAARRSTTAGPSREVRATSKGRLRRPVRALELVVSSGVYMDDVQKQALVFTAIMALSGNLLVLIVLALSWVIGNRIARPLKQATAVAEGIASGRLDSHIGPQPHDEPGRLLEAMSGMQQQLHAVISGQREMARRHDAGELSYRIDASAFRASTA